MKKEKTKENPKVIFEDDCMTVFEHKGRRIVKFRSEMKGKFNVELEAEENSKISQFSISSKLKSSSIDIKSLIPVVVSSAPITTIDDGLRLIVNNIHHIEVKNFCGSLEAISQEQRVAVGFYSHNSLISLPEDKTLAVHLLEKDDTEEIGIAQAYLSFGKLTKTKYSCDVRSNLELWVTDTPKVTLMEGFNKQPIVCEKSDGKNAGYFEHIIGPFGQITEKIEDNHSVYQISKSTDLEIYSPGLLELYTNEINFSYSSQSVALKCKKQIPFDFNFNQAGDELAFNVDKSNGFMVKSYKNQLKEFSCSYEPDRGALILATPLLALDSYLYSKSTDFSLRDVTEQKLNFVLKSSGNEINLKSDNGSEKNRFHINLDGFMPMLTVRGDKVTSSNVNMNIRGSGNYVEAAITSPDQSVKSRFIVDQLRGKSSMSNT
jgi:hypothetical protein